MINKTVEFDKNSNSLWYGFSLVTEIEGLVLIASGTPRVTVKLEFTLGVSCTAGFDFFFLTVKLWKQVALALKVLFLVVVKTFITTVASQ